MKKYRVGIDVGAVFLLAGLLLGLVAGRFAGSRVRSLKAGKGGLII